MPNTKLEWKDGFEPVDESDVQGRSQEILDHWKPIKSAPFLEVLEVRNELMDSPELATRGYVHNGMVHSNQNLFMTLSGQLCCPTEWRVPK